MSGLFFLLCIVGIALWFYGLSPFLRVRKYLAANRFVTISDIYKDNQHPQRDDLIKVAWAYSGFIICCLLGMLVGQSFSPA